MLVLLGVGGFLAYHALAPFDRKAWERGRNGYDVLDNPRQGLVIDAMDRLPRGTPRATVHDLLGPADGTEDICDLFGLGDLPADGLTRPTDHYALGFASLGIDAEVLVIEYDTAGRVIRWWIERG